MREKVYVENFDLDDPVIRTEFANLVDRQKIAVKELENELYEERKSFRKISLLY